MKRVMLLALVSLLCSSAFANRDELCGVFVMSEDSYEGKPANEYLGVINTVFSWEKYYLKPKGANQTKSLKALKAGKEYCVTGGLSWCGRNSKFKCLTIQSVKSFKGARF